MKTTKIEKNYFSELVDDFGWVENVPSWAINYLTNGDATDLSESEIAECDAWYTNMQANGMLDFVILRVNDKGEYTDDMNCSVASGFYRYPAFGEATDCEECLIITNDWNEKLSGYNKKMKYIEDNDFDYVIDEGMYGDAYNVFFADSYGYKNYNFLVENVGCEQYALEAVAQYCKDNNIVDGWNIRTQEQFDKLCMEEFGEISCEENDWKSFEDELDLTYVDGLYFNVDGLRIEKVKEIV